MAQVVRIDLKLVQDWMVGVKLECEMSLFLREDFPADSFLLADLPKLTKSLL
jgi:hypothetical protein